MKACPRCSAATAEDDLRLGAGVCPRCVLAIAVEEDPPALPNLEIQEVIGRGGMGIVYRARQTSLGRTVAVKLVKREGDAAFESRFAREARALAQMSHPNIVAVYDSGVSEGVPYIVMECVEGESLRRKLAGGPLPLRETIAIAEQLCGALKYAHERGLVHRDVKPENVLIDKEGRVKLADFGLARGEGEVGVTRTGAVMGTPAYMAPEQIERPAAVDARADLYALGAVMYEMLTGKAPLGRVRPPKHLAPVVMRLLEREPEARYASAADVREALAERPRGWVGLAAISVLLFAAAAAAAVGVTFLAGRDQRSWEDLGAFVVQTAANSESPAIAGDHVAWAEAGEIRVRRWEGSAWVDVGGTVSGRGARWPSIALDRDARPVVAWTEGEPASEVRVARWDGASWASIGRFSGLGRAEAGRVAVDQAGAVHVAWHLSSKQSADIYTSRWDGGEWRKAERLSFGDSWALWPRLALDGDGHPLVAWTVNKVGIHVQRWDGAAWRDMGEVTYGQDPLMLGALCVDSGGWPVVAWHVDLAGNPEVRVARWDGTGWRGLAGSESGGGVSRNAGVSLHPSLAARSGGRVAVAWQDGTGGRLEMRCAEWDATAWTDLPWRPTEVEQTMPVLAVDAQGRVLVAWQDGTEGRTDVRVRRTR